ncbi:OmpA family protein [uncultured Alistipes sp.]|jgi:OmpA family protein|uniref:OmpA family protein n=1 Tax=uncultured Alistipes sp. TaxID=538949 RepID=UPI0025E97EA1|nr:OmpA family protein [uncultured Alistipes sp.]
MKHFCFIALFFLFSSAASAQENGNRDDQNRIVRGPYETNRLFDNMFVGIAGGVNIYFGEHDSYGKFGKRLAPALDIHVGKWFTPSVGARVGYSGLQAKGWTTAGTIYAKGADGDMFKEKFGVSYLHGDVLWNLSNAISGYKESRTWNFVPYIGVGWARSYGNDKHDNEIGFDVGLLNIVRLSDLVDLTLETRCLLVNQRFDGVTGGRIGEGMLSVTAGLSFKFNRRGFKRASQLQPIDYIPYLERIKQLESSTDDLASQISHLNAENEQLRNKPAVIVESEPKVSASPVALFFSIGKATLDQKELTNLEFYVKNAVKADRNKTFTLIGSADKATGTKEINQRLSEQRMEYVYKLLTDKYGIAPERLVKKAEGDTNNRFAEPELNRAVIVE